MSQSFSFQRLLKSFSKIVSEEKPATEKLTPQQKAHQTEIENCILVLAAEVIRCDRNYSDDTEHFVRQFISTQFGAKGLNQRMKAIHNHLDTGTEPYLKIACKELVLLTTQESRLSVIRFLLGVACADNFITAKETRCVHRLAGYLKVSDAEFKELKQNFINKNNPFSVLGIENDSTLVQAKAAYRKMVLKFHPDKREEGVSEKEAETKFREIQHAFETIQKQLEE